MTGPRIPPNGHGVRPTTPARSTGSPKPTGGAVGAASGGGTGAAAAGWVTSAASPASATSAAVREQGLEQGRAALATFSAQGQVLLNAVARHGYDEVVDPLMALVSSLRGTAPKDASAHLRVADAARALEYERIALGTVLRDVRRGALTPQTFGRQRWDEVDLMQVAHRRLSAPGFDPRAEAKTLQADPDWARSAMVLPGADAKPIAQLSVAELDRWGQRVKSSTRWLTDAGTQQNLQFWRELPVVKALHQQARDVARAPAAQRDQLAQLASLRTGLAMAQGGALAPAVEPTMLAAAARAAGLEPSKDLGALCRDLQGALGRAPLSSLPAPERAALEKLLGPPAQPGAALQQRLSSDHWQSFLRTMPQFIVETGVATAATMATAGALPAAGSVGLAASGMVTNMALDGLLKGEVPTVTSLANGAVMGMAGSGLGKVTNGLAATVLQAVPTSTLAGQVTAQLVGHSLNSTANTALGHFVASVKDGVPFTENFAEDLLRSLVASSTTAVVAAQLRPRLDAAQQLVASGPEGSTPAREATGKALNEARRARAELGERAKAVEDLAAQLALGPSAAEAKALGAKYVRATRELQASGARLGAALESVEASASKLPKDQSKKLLAEARAWSAELRTLTEDVAVTKARPAAPAREVEILKKVSNTEIVDALTKADNARLDRLKSGATTAAPLVTPEDGTAKVKAMHMAVLGADQTGIAFPLEVARVGKREGFDVVLRVPAGEERELRKFFAEKKLTNVKLIPVKDSADLDFWSEDQGELHLDGSVSVPRSLYGAGDLRGEELTRALTRARFDRLHPRTEVDLSTEESLYAARWKHRDIAYSGVGAVGERGGQRAIAAVALAGKKELRVSNAYLEGGNSLVGRRASGEGFAVVGADSLAVSRAALAKELGRPVGEAEVRTLVARDYGVDPKQLVVVEQPGDFHIDMHMSLLPGGKALVNDARAAFELQKRWLTDDLRAAEPKPPPPDARPSVKQKYEDAKALWDIERETLPRRLKELDRLAKATAAQETRMAKDLERGGLEVTRVPGVFNGWGGDVGRMNFMNFEQGRNDKGQHFIISLGGDPRAEALVKERLTAAAGDVRVHFLDPKLTDPTLAANGGISCRVKLECTLVNVAVSPQKSAGSSKRPLEHEPE